MTYIPPSNNDRRTNRVIGVLAILGLTLVGAGLFLANDTISTIGGIMAALSLILTRQP